MGDTPNLHMIVDPDDDSHPEGWDALVERMATEIRTVSPDVRLSQVKEKYGGLRVYLSPSQGLTEALAERVGRIISRHEAESLRTCEVCGQSGAVPSRDGGWLRALCAVHEVMER